MKQGLLICTPAYGGVVTEAYLRSALALRTELTAVGLPHDWMTLANESLITRGRNVCAASFLRETDLSHLLFIDADIEFEPDGVARLWNLCMEGGADVAVGAYRMKKPGAALAAWVDGKLLTDVEGREEPFEVDYAGTGFMLIPRQTLERLKRPEIEHEEGQIGQCWAFFDTGVEDGIYLSEDYFFSKRVREAGMRIVMDPKIKLKHHGTGVY